jgi:hypothetical protein
MSRKLKSAQVLAGVRARPEQLQATTTRPFTFLTASAAIPLAQRNQSRLAVPIGEGQALHSFVVRLEREVEEGLRASPEVSVENLHAWEQLLAVSY